MLSSFSTPLRYLSSRLVPHAQTLATILSTTNFLNRASSVTLGPSGRLVAIQSQLHQPRLTKDGVTVIKSIDFEDRLMNAVALLVKKAVGNANKYSGDGTTTTTLLAFELLRIADRKGAFEVNQRELREGLEMGKSVVIEFLEELAVKVETKEKLKQVAMIATNGDDSLSELISQAIFTSTNVKIEKSNSTTSSLLFTDGLKITRGIPHQMLVNKINKIEFNYPVILVYKGKIGEVRQILPAIEKAKTMRKPLVVFAEDISQGVSSMLYYNHFKGIVESCPVRVPERGSESEKLLLKVAEATGAYLFSQFSGIGIEAIGFGQFGKCVKISIDEFETTITCSTPSFNSSSNSPYRTCLLSIGAPSESQLLETYDKAVDALNSVQSAQRFGVVPGGGLSYYRASSLLFHHASTLQNPIHTLAYRMLAQSLQQPLKTLFKLGGIQYFKQTEGWIGMNLKTKNYEDLMEAGILDSLIVAKNCVIDGVGVASMLLSVELAVVKETEYKESEYDIYKGRFEM